jgi:hypothetical protein
VINARRLPILVMHSPFDRDAICASDRCAGERLAIRCSTPTRREAPRESLAELAYLEPELMLFLSRS